MISEQAIRRLVEQAPPANPILSIYLDLSVGSDNKRTHQVFLNQRRSELLRANGSDAPAIEDAFATLDHWLDNGFVESNKGAAVFIELGGDYFESLQFPVPVANRLEVSDRPCVGPLVEILARYRRHGVAVVDRSHCRLLCVALGTALAERTIEIEAMHTPNDVQRGGWSQATYQRRKAEETRHAYKQFASELERFLHQNRADDLVLVGTEENVTAFLECIPEHVRKLFAGSVHAPSEASTPDLLARLAPLFDEQNARREAELIGLLRERVEQRHLAVSGFHETLVNLQEGKVDTLVVGRNVERRGAQCTECGFYLWKQNETCPYCGGPTRASIDLVEGMIRMAASQEVRVEFAEPDALTEMNSVGALLRF